MVVSKRYFESVPTHLHNQNRPSAMSNEEPKKTIALYRGYKFRLYTQDANAYLHQKIDIAGLIWNHALALCKRYYRMYRKGINFSRLQSHLAKLRKSSKRFAHYHQVGSQAVQDVVQRLQKAYQKFFTKQGGFPRFKKVKRYKSFTLKQTAGWKLLPSDGKRYAKVSMDGRVYKFRQTRPIAGIIKTVTIKRDGLGHLWICFSVLEEVEIPKPTTSEIGGFDFGIKTFLTNDEGQSIEAPQFFKQGSNRIAQLNRNLARKQKGSKNHHKAKRQLATAHEHIVNQRHDYFFKLAHQLCDTYEVLCFEDLNIAGMKRRWGRIVSDYSFSTFTDVIKHVAAKRGNKVVTIDRWYPSSKTCSQCGAVKQDLTLRERLFDCEACGLVLDRDHNAARNIKRVGASTLP